MPTLIDKANCTPLLAERPETCSGKSSWHCHICREMGSSMPCLYSLASHPRVVAACHLHVAEKGDAPSNTLNISLKFFESCRILLSWAEGPYINAHLLRGSPPMHSRSKGTSSRLSREVCRPSTAARLRQRKPPGHPPHQAHEGQKHGVGAANHTNLPS